MKKLIMVLLLSMIGYNMPTINKTMIDKIIANNDIDKNQIAISLYKGTDEGLVKLKEYKSTWISKQDIIVATTIFTEEDVVSGYYFQDIFPRYSKNYNNIDEYRIGYHISISLENGTILENTILSPKDGMIFSGYISIYLYDDIHVNKGAWYRHIEENEIKDNTLFTSIKITAEKNIDKIIAPITLTTFAYKQNEFDKNGNYNGNSKYTITLKNEFIQ